MARLVYIGYKLVCQFSLSVETSYLASTKTVCDLLLPTKSMKNGCLPSLRKKQNLGNKLFITHSFWQEVRDSRQSQLNPSMTDSLGKKEKLADWFIPCGVLIG